MKNWLVSYLQGLIAWNKISKVPNHDDRQWRLSLLFQIENPAFLLIINNFLPIIDRWSAVISSPVWRPVYTGDFCCNFSCDFLLLEDVKKWMSYKCSRLWNLITTSLSNLHILQKEKIATKIAAKIARVNGPSWREQRTPNETLILNYPWFK